MFWLRDARSLVLLAATTACLCLVDCKPDPLVDPASEVAPTGTPLAQTDSIPIEVETGDDAWRTVHASREGIERVAYKWCDNANEELADRMLCPDPLPDPSTLMERLETGTHSECSRHVLCWMRRQVCAGQLMSEMARSPVQKVLDARQMTDSDVFNFVDLGIQPGEWVFAPDTSPIPTTQRIRFQPLTGPGKAAALRGALNRFREATRIAHLMRTYPSTSGTTCLEQLRDADYNGTAEPPFLMAYQDGTMPTWSDAYYQTFLDAAFEYSNNVSRAAEATRAAGDSVMAGKAPLSDEIATRWNGEYDSVSALVNRHPSDNHRTPARQLESIGV